MIKIQKELKRKYILTKQDLPMKANGLMDLEMDMVFRNGKMVLFMKDSGVSDKHKVKANSYMLMEIYTRAIGITIKQMDKEFIVIEMEHSTQALGFMTSSMVMAIKHFQKDLLMKEIMKKEKNME